MRVNGRVLLLATVGLISGICGITRADHSLGVFNTIGDGPISFLSADTIRGGCWTFGAHSEYVSLHHRSDDELTALALQGFNAESVEFTTVTFVSAAYGVTDNFNLVARLPYAEQARVREAQNQGGTILLEDQGNATGLGDVLLLGVLKLWDSDAGDVRISAIFGLETPTGQTDDRTRQGNLFAPEHQPGSGSWDPLAGLAVSVGQDGWSFHANATYLHTTEGRHQADSGDVFNCNLSAVYRISHHDDYPRDGEACILDSSRQPRPPYCCHRGPALDFVVELNGTWQAESAVAGAVDHDSGGHLLLIAPGLRYTHHKPWCIYGSCGFPILQDQNGANREAELRVVFGAIVNY